jgi:glyoxylase-like metal-dependent hydrolase (beta-lactamase superfamily II)
MYRSLSILLLAAASLPAAVLPEGATFTAGPINRLSLPGFSVYVAAGSSMPVLVTHARRDLVAAATGGSLTVPDKERDFIEHPETFWEQFETGRFHDYAQVSTKVPVRASSIQRAVHGGEALTFGDAKVTVLDTPGYTSGAVTYLIEWKGKRIACTGDLIYGDGQLFDLYSLQDSIPALKARGYHGYAARAADLIASLRKVAAWNPDVIVPARGALIETPRASIEKEINRLQAVLRSHYTTDALRWYWGDDHLRTRAGGALDGKSPDWMPTAETQKLPDWIIPISNSRLIISTSGAAFLVDAGYEKIIPELEALQQAGRFKNLEGVWITHYHDDHTDNAQAVSDRFHCPIYFNDRLRDILEKPAAYRMPCLTTNPIRGDGSRPDGSVLRWHEFRLTMDFFPGQTLYHDGLYLERETGESIFFAGDSFTPSGMDDYCLLNRDFLRPGEGYYRCLDLLSKTKPGTWVINQHVAPMFRFSADQLGTMRRELSVRTEALAALAPWPDPNYAVDESWARIYPYGSTPKSGDRLTLELKILNHSPRTEAYNVQWHVPRGLKLAGSTGQVTIGPRAEGRVKVMVDAIDPGLHLVTADVEFGGMSLPEWTEAMVRVK